MPAQAQPRPAEFDTARLLDLLPGLVAYVDREFRYSYANATYATWRGIDPTRIVGMHLRDVVGRRSYPAIAARVRRALDGETVVWEYHLFDGDRRRPVQGTYLPDRDQTGRVCGAVLHVTDLGIRGDLQARIAQDEALLDDAFLRTPLGMAEIGVDGRLMRVNDAFARMLGRDADAMAGADFRAFTHPDDAGLDGQYFAEVLQGRRDGYRLEKRCLRGDGGVVRTATAMWVLRDLAGEAIRFIAQIEDVTAAHTAQAALARSNARLALAIDATSGGMWHIDVAEQRFECSPQLARLLTGDETATLTAHDLLGMVDEADRERASFADIVRGETDSRTVEYLVSTASGRRMMTCEARSLRDEHGAPIEIVGFVRDITEERDRQRVAERQAETDPLTGLLNRRGLERRIAELGRDAPFGVAVVDLDHFKRVNDARGHDAGDAVLVETAERLRALVRDRDLIARMGGDEFLIALPGATEAVLERVAARICEALAADFFASGGASFPVGASIGVALGRKPDQSFAAVVAAADRALYRVKTSGRAAWAIEH